MISKRALRRFKKHHRTPSNPHFKYLKWMQFPFTHNNFYIIVGRVRKTNKMFVFAADGVMR